MIYFLVFLYFCCSSIAKAACIDPIEHLSTDMLPAGAGELESGASVLIDVTAKYHAAIRIKNPSRKALALSLAVHRKNAVSFNCQSDTVALRAGQEMLLDIPVLWPVSSLRLSSPATGANFSYEIHSDIHRNFHNRPEEIIERPLYIFAFDNHPEHRRVKRHIGRAIRIWKSAGIHFKPFYESLSKDRTTQILGEDGKMKASLNYAIMNPDDASEVNSISGLRENRKVISVVFANTTWSGVYGTRADIYRNQIYVDRECGNYGVTIAHEIGHILLGAGHTGNPNVRWTSSLMRKCGQISPDVSDEDMSIARKRAARLPEKI